jgi:hypothetical protein
MRGPYWNHGKTGVTGEAPAKESKYTVAVVDGQRRTYLGDQQPPAGAEILEQVGH